MYLSDKTIKRLIERGDISVEPDFNIRSVRPAGIRVHLATELLVPEKNQYVELSEPQQLSYKKVDISEDVFKLEPGGFVLGATKERIKTPRDILTFIDGRSTVARLGLTVHLSATTADGTFDSPHSIVLEIANLGSVTVGLKSGDPIGMVTFAKLTEPIESELQSQYKGQDGVAPPNLKFKTGSDV